MPGTAVSQAPRALLVLLVLVGAVGCAGVPRGAPRASASVAPTARSASSEAPARLPIVRTSAGGGTASDAHEPHLELELVSQRHTVAPGETLFRIARAYGVSVEALRAANGIKDVTGLAVGQELLIPGSERPVPVATAPAPSSAREDDPERPPSPRKAPGSSRPGARPPPKPVPETKGTLDWPLRGVLYARFGKKGREPHDGIDLAVPVGTPVKTAQEGEVLYAGEQRGYGLIVIVQHSERLITLYAHNRDLRVRTGQKVRREQVLATVGESGKTSGPAVALRGAGGWQAGGSARLPGTAARVLSRVRPP